MPAPCRAPRIHFTPGTHKPRPRGTDLEGATPLAMDGWGELSYSPSPTLSFTGTVTACMST